MRDSNFGTFSAMLEDIAAFYPTAKPPTASAKAMFFRALRDLSLEQVRAGFDAHLRDPQRGRFMPLPADVIAQVQGMQANDGRPGPEEAWATALRARDETDSVFWTDETSEAWRITRPILQAGDEVGARMAFREAYQRLVGEARAAGRMVRWTVSEGFDAERRQRVIEKAIASGLIDGSAYPALPAPREVVALLAGPAAGIPKDVQTALLKLVETIRGRQDAPSLDVIAREKTAERKREVAEAVASHLADGSRDDAAA